jgi:1-aminocyclopropane-1-carboxylate deaminase/D-cysteine desulfhydrase-like pyridoxal-dependent ACC family enzyme
MDIDASPPRRGAASMPDAPTLPLFARFPGAASVPLAGIAALPTPVDNVEAPWLAEEPIGGLWVKRDDLTSGAYGGNKVRKLDFLLGEAVALGATSVLTFGAYGSNHALATAVHASALGLEPHVVLSPQEPGPFAPATLLAHAGLGTIIHLADGWDGEQAAIEAIAALTERDGVAPYVIPMGGTNALGALGYVNAALEAWEQAKTLDLGILSMQMTDFVRPDVVYVAAGTLGTAVGLAIGFAAAGSSTRVEAIRVTPSEVASEDVARALAVETIALLHSLDDSFGPLDYDDLALSLRDDHFEPGYGVVTPATEEAVALAEAAGIKLETTYTGKAFSAMLDYARRGSLSIDDHVLFWNTYNSAPMPAAGDIATLPEELQVYIAECERRYGVRR